MVKIIECEQYTPDWWAARRGVPTASAFSRIITPAKGEYSKQARDYACELIGDKFDLAYPREDYQSAAMRYGSEQEAESRDWYAVHFDVDVRQVGFVLSDSGRFGASPDGLIGDHGVLELKNPTAKEHVKYLIDAELPAAYRAQCHGLLLVTERHWCDFVSYCPGLPAFVYRVERDGFTAKLAAALEKFWKQYLEIINVISQIGLTHADADVD